MHPTEIDIRYLVRGLTDQLVTISLYTGIGAALAVVYIFLSTPEYATTALLRVDPPRTSGAEPVRATGPEAIGTHIESEIIFLTSDQVLERVIAELDLRESAEFGATPGLTDALFARLGVPGSAAEPDERALLEETIQNVREAMGVRRVGTSLLVEVTARSESPETAARLANTTIDAYFEESVTSAKSAFDDLITERRNRLPGVLSELEAERRAFESFVEQSASEIGPEMFMLFTSDELSDEIARAVRPSTSMGRLMPEESNEIIRLWNALKVKQKTYDSLQAEIVELARQAATVAAPATVQFAANVPARPVAPNKTLALGLGLVLGFITGSARALFRAPSHGFLREPQDITSQHPDMPVSVIPRRRRNAPALQNEIAAPNSPFAQGVWRLQATLCADLSAEQNSVGKVVMLSPVRTGRHESGLAYSLAKSLSVAGFRTVFVSLAPPHLRWQRLPIRGDSSISKLLAAEDDTRVDEVLSRTSQTGLMVVTNDKSDREDMYANLFSPRLAELLFELKAKFDYVVIETAAVIENVEAIHFAPAADAMILEVPVGKVRRGELKKAKELLQGVRQSDAPLMVALSLARA